VRAADDRSGPMTAAPEAGPRRSASRPPGSRLARLRRGIAGTSPRTRWLNLLLLLLLVLVVVVCWQVLNGSGPQEPAGRTVVVNRGEVTALVTGSGNTGPSLSTPVSFGTTATVTAVKVKAGDTVKAGQVLATVDDTAVRASLRTARAQYDNAAAALAEAEAGPTEVKKQQDQLAVTQAQQALDNANAAVKAAQDKLGLDKESTQTAIDNAKDKRGADKKAQDEAVHQAEDNADTACSSSGTTTGATTGTGTTTDTGTTTGPGSSSCTSAKQSVQTAKNTRSSTLLADDQAVTTAEQTRDSTLHTDQTSIDQAKQDVTTAGGNITSAQLTAQADLAPKTPAQIAQARASVDSAQVTVDTAQHDLEQTVLKAPQDGVVLAVNGKVGQSSGSTSSGSSSSASASASSSGAGSGGSGASGTSSVPAVATTAGDGFVVLANLSQLAVSASVPEADAAKLALGQKTRVSFPGTDTTATGTVTQITPQSTVSNNVVLYPISVSLDTAPPGVGVGSTAELAITTGTAQNVLRVPTQAITTNGTRHTVTVRKGGVDSVVAVEVGVSGPTDTEVTGGVAQGDTLVLPGTGGNP
jgi:HlyD family secretion protein